MFHVEQLNRKTAKIIYNNYILSLMTNEELKGIIRNIPDFPIPGIQFKDITTALLDRDALRYMRDEISAMYRDKGITKVVGIESRGFILGGAVAAELNAGFVPIRKPGKLPGETIKTSIVKEYGRDMIEVHAGALNEDDVVLLHDDLLATGGSMAGAIELVRRCGVKKIYVNFIVELDGLEGRNILKDVEVTSLVHYPDK